MTKTYDELRLENQLCFPFYVCSKEIVRHYKPYLDKIDLTYTQYITMMVMWEHNELNTKEMGHLLYLDSGTLTPVLKKLENKGYVSRHRDHNDERNLLVTLTPKGEALKEEAIDIPKHMAQCIDIDPEDAKRVWMVIHKIMEHLHEK